MAEHKELYIWSLEESVRLNERDAWRESHRENCDCARAMERAIAENYSDNCLHNCIQPIIDRYGFNRVNWVLANTVKQHSQDGRFSQDNKLWARRFHIPQDGHNWHFSVESHPGLTDLLIGQARKAWQALGLFDSSYCISEKEAQIDYTGKVVVIDPSIFKDQYKTPDDQLFLAEGGFGCQPNARGRKVFGQFLKDGEQTHYHRSDIIGVLKDEYLPQWAQEKLAELTAPDEGQSEGMTMGGM